MAHRRFKSHCQVLGPATELTAQQLSIRSIASIVAGVAAMPSDLNLNSVIVADNDFSLRGILRSLLVQQGMSVILAADGLEAVNFAKSTRARLVLLDMRMPNLDGIQACAQIRCLSGYTEVPIVILTAFADDATREAAVEAGATHFFTKPFIPTVLLQCLAPLLGLQLSEPPSNVVWEHRIEPAPAYGEPAELSQGRKLLDVYRRGVAPPKRSGGPDRLS
jgi:CheY-like chemotaxis protein